MAKAVGTIVGATVGFFVGGPVGLVVGAGLGYAGGGYVDEMLSPPGFDMPVAAQQNQQIYTGLPIEDFPGQTGYTLPFLTRKQEYLAGQIGLTTPVSQVYRTGKAINDIIQGDLNIESATSLEGLSQGALQSVFSIGDPQVAKRRAAYDELAKLRDLMAYYKQEEIDIPTIAELENKNKNNAYNNLVRQMKAFKR
jgi:hypothetical protein